MIWTPAAALIVVIVVAAAAMISLSFVVLALPLFLLGLPLLNAHVCSEVGDVYVLPLDGIDHTRLPPIDKV